LPRQLEPGQMVVQLPAIPAPDAVQIQLNRWADGVPAPWICGTLVWYCDGLDGCRV